MTTSVNGTARHGAYVPQEFEALSRREERRRDDAASREAAREDARVSREQTREDRRLAAELRRGDREADLDLAVRRKETKRKAKDKARRERAARWTARRTTVIGAISEHMPLPGLPVVAVSVAMAWSGQMTAAANAGMGASAPGVPTIFEGLTLTVAGLTARAISRKAPWRRLFVTTWALALVAAGINAFGHLIEDSSAKGVYKACGFAAASLAGLVLWSIVMQARRVELAKLDENEVARWRRLRRRHPFLSRRARAFADVTGLPFQEAWDAVWERRNGAPATEPTIREIRSTNRTQYRRAKALAWDGRRRWSKSTPVSGAEEVGVDHGRETVDDEAVPTLPPASQTPAATVPGLWVATRSGADAIRMPMTVPTPGTASAANPVPGTPSATTRSGAEFPFPPDQQAGNRAADTAGAVKLSKREMKRAAAVWTELHDAVRRDRRRHSPTGHLGVSPYTLASTLKLRRETGPAVVAALIDAGLIPAS